MSSDSESGDTAQFAECLSPGGFGRSAGRGRIPEIFHRAAIAGSSKKRSAPSRGSKSPKDSDAPAAKRSTAAMELSPAALTAIKRLIDSSEARVIAAFDAKLERLDGRLSTLEAQVLDREDEIQQLKVQMGKQHQAMEELQERVEGMDMNRRSSNLILTCDDFAAQPPDVDAEEMVVQTLCRRLPGFRMTVADVQVAHRLETSNKVIVRFMKQRLRDEVFDSRFLLFNTQARLRAQGLAPLYLTESLTADKRHLYASLLAYRRPENGGKIASVFTRRGTVFCRTEKGGRNIKVTDQQRLQ